MTDRVDLEAIKARAASAARSGLADPANPNYFLTGSIIAMRGGLSDLRDYIMEPGDFDASELGEIATRLIKLAWPTSQPGFSAADERERSAWAAWPDDVDAMAAELASLRAQRDALPRRRRSRTGPRGNRGDRPRR